MGENSKIEWTHHTWNLWRGCTEVSPGCDHCYARELAKRNPAVLGEWRPGAPRVLAAEAYRKLPLKWNAQAQAAGERRRVFALSMGDWLDEEVPAGWLAALLDMVRQTPWLDWLLLTKRPQNFEARIYHATNWMDEQAPLEAGGVPDVYSGPWAATSLMAEKWRLDREPPANVWVGTTVEDQTRADERIPQLLQIPARVRFLSCEPLLGPLDLSAFMGVCPNITGERAVQYSLGLHWVICGGESGPQARPMHPQWAKALCDDCQEAGVPFFFKQWGAWRPQCEGRVGRSVTIDAVRMVRGDTKENGRVLFGREWNGSPDVFLP